MPSRAAIHSPAMATRSGARVITDTVGGVTGVAAAAFWSRQPAADDAAAAMDRASRNLFMDVTRSGGGWEPVVEMPRRTSFVECSGIFTTGSSVRPHLKARD